MSKAGNSLHGAILIDTKGDEELEKLILSQCSIIQRGDRILAVADTASARAAIEAAASLRIIGSENDLKDLNLSDRLFAKGWLRRAPDKKDRPFDKMSWGARGEGP